MIDVPKGPARSTVLLTAAYWVIAVFTSFEVAARWTPAHGLSVQAWASADRSGPVVFTGTDATLSTALLLRRPFTSMPSYSAEWTGMLDVPEAGTYSFWLRSDGRSSLEVDDAVVVDHASRHHDSHASGDVVLGAGLHPLRLRYTHHDGDVGLHVQWRHDDRPYSTLDARFLLPQVVDSGTYLRQQWYPWLAGAATLATFAGILVWGLRPATIRAGPSALDGVVNALERPGVAMVVLLAVAAPIRLAFLTSTPAILWADSHVFWVSARNIAQGQWLSHDAYRTAVYPWLLAGLNALFHGTPAAGRTLLALQFAMGVATVLMLYQLGRRVFTPLVALAAAAAVALHALQLFYELSMLTEALFTCTLLVVLWQAHRAYARPTSVRGAMLGISAAFLMLIRPVAQWYLLVLLSVWVLAGRGRRRFAAAGAALACYALPLAGWMAANQHEYGFYGVSLGRGMGLYTRAFDIDELPPAYRPEMQEMWDLFHFAKARQWNPNRVRDELNYGRRQSSAQADDAMFRFALAAVAAHPVRFAVKSLVQWATQLGDDEWNFPVCGSDVGPYLCDGVPPDPLPGFSDAPTSLSRLRRALITYELTAAQRMTAVSVLALVGLVAYARFPGRTATGWLCAATIGYFTLIPALSQWPLDRYRLPVDGLLFLFALWGVRALTLWTCGASSHELSHG